MSPREKGINKLINKFYGIVFSFEDLPVYLQKLVNKKGESAWMDAQRLLGEKWRLKRGEKYRIEDI